MRVDEVELLGECCRMLDALDVLRAVVAAEGPMLGGRIHPALVELRLTRMELRRSLAQLALPDPDDGDPRVLPAEVARFRTVRARKAARARWGQDTG